jgi:cell division protein FtsZ
VDAANRAISSPLLEDNSIQGAQGILINVTGSTSLALHEVHEASSIIQKAAHENANIIFGAVMDEAMKDSVKITVIAAGFREIVKKTPQQRPSYMPKSFRAAAGASSGSSSRESESRRAEDVQPLPPPAARPIPEVVQESVNDLDVPTFLRRQAQKA